MSKRKRETREKAEEPEVLTLKKIAHTAKELARAIGQINQYKALIKQILEITEQGSAVITLTDENTNNIIVQMETWMKNIQEIRVSSSNTRNEALAALRNIDVLDDDALKGAALILTESETRLAALEGLEHRFSRIVRYKTTTKPLGVHARDFLKRFLGQWVQTNKVIAERQGQFKELIVSLRMDITEKEHI
jgi:Ribonuclease G/E